MFNRKNILVITPALTGGGWISLEEPINSNSNKFSFTVVGLGPIRQKARMFKLFRLPYFDYAKKCEILALIPPLNFLYDFPLILMAGLIMIIRRPKIIIGNGFFTTLSVAFLARILGSRIVISYHGCFEFYIGSGTKKLIQILSNLVDDVYVNSEGSKEDVINVIGSNSSNVITVKHWANEAFFSTREEDK